MSTTSYVNYIDAIKDIEQFYAENTVDVWCPVAETSLKFRSITVEQFKNFIELQVAAEKDEYGVIPGLRVISEINNVIVTNNTEYGDKLLDLLSVIDRDAIVLQLRNYTKNSVDITVGEGEDPQTIDLNDVVANLKENKFSSSLKTKSKEFPYSTGTVKLNLRIPTLRVDNDINEKFRAKILPKLQKGKKHLEKEAEKILSQIYFLEICKYIDSIVIKKTSGDTKIEFANMDNFESNLLFLEKLPTRVISEVSTYMTDIKKYKDATFCYLNLENKQVPLTVDIALFAGI